MVTINMPIYSKYETIYNEFFILKCNGLSTRTRDLTKSHHSFWVNRKITWYGASRNSLKGVTASLLRFEISSVERKASLNNNFSFDLLENIQKFRLHYQYFLCLSRYWCCSRLLNFHWSNLIFSFAVWYKIFTW